MRVINRQDQDMLVAPGRTGKGVWTDAFFDGEPLPRETAARHWRSEGAVHRAQVLSDRLDSTRYLEGAQTTILRDDNRRVTWAGVVERNGGGTRQLLLCRVSGTRPVSIAPARVDRSVVAEGNIWRYQLALDKHSGKVTVAWIVRTGDRGTLWLDGKQLKTDAVDPDFPFFGFSQPPIGHVANREPPFALLSYKCRQTGRLFLRKLAGGKLGPERVLDVGGELVGGASFAIFEDKVVLRVDVRAPDGLRPRLLISDDAAGTFTTRDIDMSAYEQGFDVVPGYTEPAVDIGGNFHAPVIASNGRESAALNYVLAEDALVEAIRVAGGRPRGSLEVFPATLGNPSPYGDGTTDGYGLIMVLGTEGRLFTSNSSAGGIFFPQSTLLNHEMPLVAAFCATECYGAGLKPNFVSMDYLYLEADTRGYPIAPTLHLETWDMPLPVPKVVAKSRGAEIEVTVLSDADFEPGKVNFGFDDPSVQILDVKVTGLRTAVVTTDTPNLAGKTLFFDVDTLFHRHAAEAPIL